MPALPCQILPGRLPTVLDLNNCGIRNSGAVVLAEALYSNTSIEKLWLCGNGISKRGSRALSNMLLYNVTVWTLPLPSPCPCRAHHTTTNSSCCHRPCFISGSPRLFSFRLRWSLPRCSPSRRHLRKLLPARLVGAFACDR